LENAHSERECGGDFVFDKTAAPPIRFETTVLGAARQFSEAPTLEDAEAALYLRVSPQNVPLESLFETRLHRDGELRESGPAHLHHKWMRVS
jgi:hypothetical protein